MTSGRGVALRRLQASVRIRRPELEAPTSEQTARRAEFGAEKRVRFTYPVSVIDLVLAGRWAGRTRAKRWVLAFTIARKASRP